MERYSDNDKILDEKITNNVDGLKEVKIDDFLAKAQKSNMGEVLECARITSQRILQYYKNDVEFPVNIRKLVENVGLKISERNLNPDIGFQIRKVRGYLREREKDGWIIYLDNSDDESTNRYVIAHELCHYFIESTQNDEEEISEEHHCIDPFFPKKQDELLADILTSFLLFPPPLVLKCFKEYKEELQAQNKYPIDGFEWLRKLGQKAEISSYFTIISYQYLKFYLCRLCTICSQDTDKGLGRNKVDEELLKSDMQMIEAYAEFFR